MKRNARYDQREGDAGHEHPQHEGHADEAAGIGLPKGFRHRKTRLRQHPDRRPGEDDACRKSRDNRLETQAGDEEAIDQSTEQPDSRTRRHAGKDGARRTTQRRDDTDGDDIGERHDAADRQIDISRQDDIGLADGHQNQRQKRRQIRLQHGWLNERRLQKRVDGNENGQNHEGDDPGLPAQKTGRAHAASP
ncbi:hypothetical protein D3C72_1091390 [compost metagenome]